METRSFPADLQYLSSLINFVKATAIRLNVDAAFIKKLHLVTEEMAVNVISYAYPNGDGSLEVGLQYTNHQLVLQLTDQGVAFDPTAQSAPQMGLMAEQLDVGGWGIFLAKKYMDQVLYQRRGNNNILRLTKILNNQ